MQMNRVTTLYNAAETYPAMIKAIERAQQRIYWSNFCMIPGQAFDLFATPLVEAARRSVDVRILIDAYRSKSLGPEQSGRLMAAGVRVTWFRPWKLRYGWQANNRLHKKLLIIDDNIGFTGGVGVGDMWLTGAEFPAPWRDTHFQVHGSAVAHMVGGFVQSWNDWSNDKIAVEPLSNSADAINSPPTIYPQTSNVGKEILRCINAAGKTIHITTAYFGPNRNLRQALVQAAQRGVNIHILINGPYTDHPNALQAGRHYYADLLKHGITIYEYQPTKIHAKIMTIDEEVSCIGSANMNFRSFYHDEEFNLTLHDPELTKKLDRQFTDDLKQAKRIASREWAERSFNDKRNQAIASLARFIF